MSLQFPALPAGQHWHNPHDLSADCVGAQHRLLTIQEVCDKKAVANPHQWEFQFWRPGQTKWEDCPLNHEVSQLLTYRVLLDYHPIPLTPQSKLVKLELDKREIYMLLDALVVYRNKQTDIAGKDFTKPEMRRHKFWLAENSMKLSEKIFNSVQENVAPVVTPATTSAQGPDLQLHWTQFKSQHFDQAWVARSGPHKYVAFRTPEGVCGYSAQLNGRIVVDNERTSSVSEAKEKSQKHFEEILKFRL